MKVIKGNDGYNGHRQSCQHNYRGNNHRGQGSDGNGKRSGNNERSGSDSSDNKHSHNDERNNSKGHGDDCQGDGCQTSHNGGDRGGNKGADCAKRIANRIQDTLILDFSTYKSYAAVLPSTMPLLPNSPPSVPSPSLDIFLMVSLATSNSTSRRTTFSVSR